MRFRFICALWVLVSSSSAFGDGTLATADIFPLLKQDPELFSYLTETLEFSPGAVASRIGHVGNDRLSGARVAPYHFEARRKGTTGPWAFIITVEAKTVYFDEKAKETSLYEAFGYVESLLEVTIKPNQRLQPTRPKQSH